MSSRLGAINLNLLLSLEALLSESSVTRAAKKVGLSQPTMSHNLATLREVFDNELLVRAGSGMQLTPRATELLRPLQDALRLLDGVVAGDPAFDPAASSRAFRVATPDVVSASIGPTVAKRFFQRAPNASLTFRPWTPARTLDDLDTGEVDLVIGPRIAEGAALVQRKLLSDDYVCAVRADHPALTEDHKVTLETFAELSHVIVSPRGSGSSPVDTALAEAGFARTVTCRVSSFLAAPFVVAEADVILTAPRICVAPLATALGLRCFSPPVPLKPFEVFTQWHRRDDGDPGHAWLRALLFETAQSLAPQSAPPTD